MPPPPLRPLPLLRGARRRIVRAIIAITVSPNSRPISARAEPHVAVQHVAELVGDHALQLVAIEVHERAAGDRDRGIRRAVARRECVDPRLALEHVHLRHRHAGGDRNLLDDVAQPAA